MAHIDTGTYGAKRQTWFGGGIRAIFRKVRKRLQDADDDDLIEAMVSAVRKDDDAIRQLLAYWIPRNRVSLEPPEPVSPQKRAAQKRQKEKMVAKMRQRIERISLLMTPVIVGSEMLPAIDAPKEALAKQAGWMAGVAMLLKDGQTPRQAKITEAQARKLAGAPK